MNYPAVGRLPVNDDTSAHLGRVMPPVNDEEQHVILSDDLFDSALRMISMEQLPFQAVPTQRELTADYHYADVARFNEATGEAMLHGSGNSVYDCDDLSSETVGVLRAAGGGVVGSLALNGNGGSATPDNHDAADPNSNNGKRSRINVNQAEVQKRYRERKKNKMAELEKTVEDLRAKVLQLEKEKQQRELQGLQQQMSFTQKLMEQELQIKSLQAMQMSQQMSQQSQRMSQQQQQQRNQDHTRISQSTTPLDSDDRPEVQAVLDNLRNQGRNHQGDDKGNDDHLSIPSSEGKVSEASREECVMNAVMGGCDSETVAAVVDDGSRPDSGSQRDQVAPPGIVLHRDFTGFGGGGAKNDLVNPPQAVIDHEDMASILAAAQPMTVPFKIDDAGSDACEMQVLMASLEIGAKIKKEEQGGTTRRGAAAVAGREELHPDNDIGDTKEGEQSKNAFPNLKFKSYTEAELWFGGVQDIYDLSVEKIRMMLDVGASDGELRNAIADLNGIVNDARKSHPELALVTTAQASLQTMTDRGIPILDCQTSCMLMSKSIVDATLMQSDWQTVVETIELHVPPADITRVIEWSDGYFSQLLDVYGNRKMLLEKFKSVRLPLGADESNVYGVSTSELIARKGEAAEMSRALLLNMQQELVLHTRGCRELFTEKLSPRAAASIIVYSHPHVPDPLSMAFEFKKRRLAAAMVVK